SHHGTACSAERQRRESTRCSRPLGLQFASTPKKEDKSFNLIVCDGWRGLLQVVVPSARQRELGTPPQPASAVQELLKGSGSAQVYIPNAVTEQVQGKFYLTDSSSRSDAGRFGLITFEGAKKGTGRLLAVDLKTDTAEVVGSGIPFANGVVVTYDKSGVFVAALNARQIRYYPFSSSADSTGSLKEWRPVLTLPIPPDNLTRVQVEGKRLYAAASFGAPFVPPFVRSSDSGGLLQQLRSAVWTAWSRALRPYKPFPLFGGVLFPLMQLLPSSFFDFLIQVGAKRNKRGGQVVLFDGEGKIHKWLSRESQEAAARCSWVILHKWPNSKEVVMLVGAFRPEQPLCQVHIEKYLQARWPQESMQFCGALQAAVCVGLAEARKEGREPPYGLQADTAHQPQQTSGSSSICCSCSCGYSGCSSCCSGATEGLGFLLEVVRAEDTPDLCISEAAPAANTRGDKRC
ncbi:strictosidine synthase domain-containing protein, putative, partial [Eimeria maxima]